MKILLNMSNLNKRANKLCMESCVPYQRSSKVGLFLKELPVSLMTLYIHIATTYTVQLCKVKHVYFTFIKIPCSNYKYFLYQIRS
jgi:hypothetical protein